MSLSDEDETKVRRMYDYAYNKYIAAHTENDAQDADYWQGRKDAYRAVLAELCADDDDRAIFEQLNETSPGSRQ